MVLIVVVPLVVMTLIGLSFPEGTVLDYIAPALLATMAHQGKVEAGYEL
ncbi:unnamed protein product [marine sediment metagenome]|uniref:Uncharacterized protein n=1 Tax=marine sediment metagenome TaxID=412755 RepID=X1CQ36_9ZZZZ